MSCINALDVGRPLLANHRTAAATQGCNAAHLLRRACKYSGAPHRNLAINVSASAAAPTAKVS